MWCEVLITFPIGKIFHAAGASYAWRIDTVCWYFLMDCKNPGFVVLQPLSGLSRGLCYDTYFSMDQYRIGELAKKCKVTVRTIRYYESLGLLKTQSRTDGGQRLYSDADVVYVRRITELKELDFSLHEIGDIIRMGSEDATGERRRNALLRQYRIKLSETMEKLSQMESRAADLSWHIRQLETTDDFQECPGIGCTDCTFKEHCLFRE